jgi:4-hydroxy-tetrahydrodipicolinate reductase
VIDIETEQVFQVLIVGSGKLASELLNNLKSRSICTVLPWTNRNDSHTERTIVVHSGSGRELSDVIQFCSRTNSILVELSTSGKLDASKITFPTIMCPNINILMLKFMAMIQSYGHLFRGYRTEILESHQSTKTSKPGTAINIANSLGLNPDQIVSIRNPEEQESRLGISPEFLFRHAYHKIGIADANVSIVLETRVFGEAPYSSGLAQIIEGIYRRKLEPRIYDVVTLVQDGWI